MGHFGAERIAENFGIDIIADMRIEIAIGTFGAAKRPMQIKRKRPAGLIKTRRLCFTGHLLCQNSVLAIAQMRRRDG